jgi:hypothetical protein
LNKTFDRLDRSTHHIVLGCPAATVSRGMELEANHWFSKETFRQVLIIVTKESYDTAR